MRPGTAQISGGPILRVRAMRGDRALNFSCLSEGSTSLSITWVGKDGGTTLPDGVERESSDLVWNRNMQYTDSGQYLCNISGDNEVSTATLDLFVRRKQTSSSNKICPS